MVLRMATNYHYEGCYTNHQPDYSSSSNHHSSNKHIRKMKTFDEVVFDLLKVQPDTIAKQLTLLDLPIFLRILPTEVSGCGWTKKDKRKMSPNVDDMTKRFNHTSFWVIREILNASTLKIRAEVITHFIKIAKKLYELNNLHSLMAVVKSLTSSSIYRLSQTWALVPKASRQTFERLQNLCNEDDNRKRLRAHMMNIRLPCIPYLGMYLADVMYVNSAHPDTGGLESRDRTFKMNNILRTISEYQQSDYSNLEEAPHILHYLSSIDYIEELQRFKETENYNKSLKIEPVSSPHTEGSQNKPEFTKNTHRHKFVPGHRKSQSLGKDFLTTHNKMRAAENRIQKRQSLGAKEKKLKHQWSPKHHNNNLKLQQNNLNHVASESLPREASRHHHGYKNSVSLLDDSILDNDVAQATTSHQPNSDVITVTSQSSNSTISNLHDDQVTCITSHRGLQVARKSAAQQRVTMTSSLNQHHVDDCLEGVVRRKCVKKRGRRNSICSWKKYWARLTIGNLQLYSCKTLSSGTNRNHFKTQPSKQMFISNWMVIAPTAGDNFHHSTSSREFQLCHAESGTVYKFQVGGKHPNCNRWVEYFHMAVKPNTAPEKDLIDLNEEVR